jgi:phage portal protein BeeE
MPDGYIGAVQQMYRQNGVVFACMSARALMFAEARFQFRRIRDGRPGELFGTQDLQLLEEPWPNGTTGDLLTRALQDVDLAGNFYAWKQNANQLRVMRPDWVSIVLGSNMDAADPKSALDAEPVGYFYHPGGIRSGHAPIGLEVGEVAHWAPNPDPLARFRGMSWLTPVIREVMADGAASDHKLKFFENGATPNVMISMDKDVSGDAFDRYVDRFREQHEGVANAYKTLFLGGGADITVVGSNLRQIDFKTTQGAGETRIAAAAGIPPVIVGLSEGLAAATYSNYALAMRRFTDLTMRPLWRQISGALAPIVAVPGGAELWYDDRDIPALAENGRDAAEIQSVQAGTVHTLIAAGFEPDSVVAFIEAGGDFSKLEHSGLFSVQLQPVTGTITEGKGSPVAGVPVPTKNAPPQAPASANGAEATPANT